MNGKYPLASIVISNYNYGPFLEQAINSALSQTYCNTEIIVVDDGSTDNSREIISGYGDRIVAVLKENGGQASAFNAGFLASRGEVIFFLDADDVLLPTVVEEAVGLFENHGVAKVHWPLIVVDKHGKPTKKVLMAKLPEGNLREKVIRAGPFGYLWPPTSGNAWSRRFIENVLPIPEFEYRNSADLYLCALAPLFGEVKRLSKPAGFYRNHGENNSGREPFEVRLKVRLEREVHCLSALDDCCRKMGIDGDPRNWRRNSWWHQIDRATREILARIAPGEVFVLVDEDQWGMGKVIAGRRCIPFLERDGLYWGQPFDDADAIRELERLRQCGAGFMVFVWPHLWWLQHYAGLQRYLNAIYHCVLQNDCLVIFDLKVTEARQLHSDSLAMTDGIAQNCNESLTLLS